MTNCPKHYIKQPGLEYELSVLCSFSSFLFLMQLVTYGYSKFTIWKKENIEWTLILEWKRGNRVESFWRSLVLRFCSFNRKKESKGGWKSKWQTHIPTQSLSYSIMKIWIKYGIWFVRVDCKYGNTEEAFSYNKRWDPTALWVAVSDGSHPSFPWRKRLS